MRILLVGDSSAGKTTAALHLAVAGHTLAYADFDLGVAAPLATLPEAARARVHVQTFADELRFAGPALLPQVPEGKTAIEQFVRALESEWLGSGTWLVIDPLTLLAQSSLALQMRLSGKDRTGKRITYSDWGQAIARVESIFVRLRALCPNLLVLAHQQRLLPDEGPDEENVLTPAMVRQQPPIGEWGKCYPTVLGRKLPPRFGAYFTAILRVKVVRDARGARSVISTVHDPDFDIKLPVPPGKLPPTVPVTELAALLKEMHHG